MRILVTGGAGYIGSHVVRALTAAGHEAIVLDNLSEGHVQSLPKGVRLVEGDIADLASLDRALEGGALDGVVHMAASCLVGESMRDPVRYYDNNVVRTLGLLANLTTRGVGRFVLSSTAAVYGDPTASLAAVASPDATAPIEEDHACHPTNVYGETKLAVERALDWHARCAGLKAVSLRYFNAAGADPSGTIGEDHEVETHLIPLICQAAIGKIPHVTIMGRDYATPDGTCLRDYIHVNDLARAHVLALESMARDAGAMDLREAGPRGAAGLRVYNLGAERATSVLEVVAAAGRIAGKSIPTVDGPRRPGDPPVLLASSARIRRELSWRPELSDLDSILRTALAWHRGHPDGFEAVAAI